MKRLFILFLLLSPLVLKAQLNPVVTLTLRAPNPGVTSKDSIWYTYPGKNGGPGWLWNSEQIRHYSNGIGNIYTKDGTLIGPRLVNLGTNSLDFYSQNTGLTDFNLQPHSISITETDSISGDNIVASVATNNISLINYNLSGTAGAEFQATGGTVSGQPYRAAMSIFSSNIPRSIVLTQNVPAIKVQDDITNIGLDGTRVFNYALATGTTFIQKHALDSVSIVKADSVKATITGNLVTVLDSSATHYPSTSSIRTVFSGTKITFLSGASNPITISSYQATYAATYGNHPTFVIHEFIGGNDTIINGVQPVLNYTSGLLSSIQFYISPISVDGYIIIKP